MQNTIQTVVSFESLVNAPVELSLDQLRQVAGGFGPNDNWATASVAGPNDNWITATKLGPNDNWA